QQQRDRWIRAFERREHLELFGELHPELAASDERVDALGAHRRLALEQARGVRDERLPEVLETLARDLQAGGGAVPAIAREVPAARVQGAEQVEALDAATGSASAVSVQGDQHERPVIALDQARGDDPDDARMPAVPGEHVRGQLATRLAQLAEPALGRGGEPAPGLAAPGGGGGERA